jgi:Protein of unknown function (DUF1559)
LPFLEQDSLAQVGSGLSGVPLHAALRELSQSPVSVFACPTRRSAEPLPYTEGSFPLFNCETGPWGAKTDYAINAGDRIVHGRPGPVSIADFNSYSWPNLQLATGISFSIMSVRQSEIVDGLSHTLLTGEKHVPRDSYTTCISLGDDQTMYIGDDADNRRWTYNGLVPDWLPEDIESFGSAHPGSAAMLLCDGSVKAMSFDVSIVIFRQLGNCTDGGVLELE